MDEGSALGDIDEVYAAHFRGLTAELYAYTGDLGAAQEMVQEAFCRAIPVGGSVVVTMRYKINRCDPQRGYLIGPSGTAAAIDWPWGFGMSPSSKVKVIGC